MPSSTTAARCAASRRRSSVSGRPMSLLKLPCGREARRRRCQARRIDAIICVTVVLPLLPVDRDQRQVEAARARRRRAAPSARLRVGHLEAGQAGVGEAALGERRHRAARPCASARKSCASKRSPLQRDEQVARRAACACRCARASIGDVAVADQARAGQQRVRLRRASSCGMRAAPRSQRGACALGDVGERDACTPAISW